MNKKEYNSLLRAAWTSWEKEHNIQVPQDIRKYIENKIGDSPDETIGLKDLEYSIQDFMGAWIMGHTHAISSTQQSETSHENADTKRMYRKPLEKRLYLVEFVAENVLTFHNLIDRSFAHQKRIGWKKLAQSWNKKHPYDAMTPERLRIEYYRIIRDEVVQREFFNRQDRRFAEFATESLRKEATIFAEAIYRAMGEDFKNFKVGIGVDESSDVISQALINQGWQPIPHAWEEANYMRMLTQKAIDMVKAKISLVEDREVE